MTRTSADGPDLAARRARRFRCGPEGERLAAGALLLALLFLGGLGTGCSGHDVDALYALPLDKAPTEADWAAATPLSREALGGRTSRPGESDVDSDAVHTATASCHHGSGAPAVAVDLRAFYTAERLYLRVEWVDPTENVGPRWRWDRGAWRATSDGGGQDGLGVLWSRGSADFSCARACHLRDWRMAEPRAFAEYAMAAPTGSLPLDLWVWRAGRGPRGGAAEDARLGPEGRDGDGPGDFDAPNSAEARAGGQPFQAGDAPLETPPPGPGATAPGRVLLPSPPGRTEVSATLSRSEGRWAVVLSRRLRGLDADDVSFAPGHDQWLGISTLDGVAKDHNAVADPIRLVLVDRATLVAAKE